MIITDIKEAVFIKNRELSFLVHWHAFSDHLLDFVNHFWR